MNWIVGGLIMTVGLGVIAGLSLLLEPILGGEGGFGLILIVILIVVFAPEIGRDAIEYVKRWNWNRKHPWKTTKHPWPTTVALTEHDLSILKDMGTTPEEDE